MATCKNCLHSRVCFDSEGTTRYYGTEIAANNVEDLCPCFADRSRYVVREKGEWKPCFVYTGRRFDSCTQGVEGWECSNCGYTTLEKFDFCTCGADMRIELALPESKTMEFKRWTYKDGEDNGEMH